MGWSHRIHEKDAKLNAYLRKAPKLTHDILHLGDNKQAVQHALAIFHKTTIAWLKSLFPYRSDFSEILSLINTWWLIPQFEAFLNNNKKLKNAAARKDNVKGMKTRQRSK